MLDKFVKNYVDKLTINDVELFARENGIFFSQDELRLVFSTIKEKWSIILKKDNDQILMDIKNKVNNENYEKIKRLLYIYREKYKYYL